MKSPTPAELVEQSHREAAARVYAMLGFGPCQHILDGMEDDIGVVQEFARQRIAERERCARLCEEQQQVFLSPQYATGQPLSSIQERFACGRCAVEIRATPSPADGDER